MNYTKPEVAVLGRAARVIESTNSKSKTAGYDSSTQQLGYVFIPAYDLDE